MDGNSQKVQKILADSTGVARRERCNTVSGIPRPARVCDGRYFTGSAASFFGAADASEEQMLPGDGVFPISVGFDFQDAEE
jgi:hypothetical protein